MCVRMCVCARLCVRTVRACRRRRRAGPSVPRSGPRRRCQPLNVNVHVEYSVARRRVRSVRTICADWLAGVDAGGHVVMMAYSARVRTHTEKFNIHLYLYMCRRAFSRTKCTPTHSALRTLTTLYAELSVHRSQSGQMYACVRKRASECARARVKPTRVTMAISTAANTHTQ